MISDETRDILTKLEATFTEWCNKYPGRNEYDYGLTRAYANCAEEIQDILDGTSTP